jgi:hypothetical protein
VGVGGGGGDESAQNNADVYGPAGATVTLRLAGRAAAVPPTGSHGCSRPLIGCRGRPASGTGNLKQCGIVTPTGRVYSAGPGRWLTLSGEVAQSPSLVGPQSGP